MKDEWQEQVKALQEQVKALQKSEAKFKAYLEKSPLAIFVADMEGRYTGVNQAACRMSGYTEEELLNLSISDFIAPEFLEQGMKMFKRFKAEGHSEEEIMARRKNGETFWIHLAAVEIDHQAVAFCQDITERKEGEERAKELNCLHDFSRLLRKENSNLEKIMEGTVNLLPFALQYPEDASACITFKGREFRTQSYEPTLWKISAHLALHGEQSGMIEVCYRKPPLHEREPFSKEEKLMLETIAVHLSIVTEQIKAKELLDYQIGFEKMLAEVSGIFATLPSDQLEQSIHSALEKIGEFFQIERSYVFQFSDDGKLISNTYEWCAEGIEAQMDSLQNISIDAFPWYAAQIVNKKNVIIPDVESLPPEKEAEKKLLLSQGVRSLLSIPMMNNGNVFGFLGIDAVKEKKNWTENQIMLLTIVTELMSNAYIRKLAEEKVLYNSLHDSLTGLYNRFFLEKEMERLDTERQLPIGIIMVDLNGFKMVNDTFGHDVGDEMLKQTAEIFRKSCRREDIIARWGGDEFVIFLPQTTEGDVKSICQRIEEKCKKIYVKAIPLSLAIGFAIKNSKNQDLTEVLKEADDSMYEHKSAESQRAKRAVLDVSLKELETKSFETEDHYVVMQKIAQQIGKKKGLSQSEFDKLEKLILMHDIGKVKIPEEILTKEGFLTDEEWEIVKKHPETGYRIVRATEELAQVAEDILSHHERWDGTGYPQGLKGDEIPLLARITAIAEAYEVMSTGRPYKEAIPKHDVIAELKSCAGSQFDPELIKIFLLLLETEPLDPINNDENSS